MASPDRSAPVPPAENQNQATLALILAAIQDTNARLDAMGSHMDRMEAHGDRIETRLNNSIDGVGTSIIQRLDAFEERLNKRFDRLESFHNNTAAQARNAYARENGFPYTPLVKEDGSAIQNFPRTFDEVNALSDVQISTLLRAVDVEPKDDWSLSKKRRVFLATIGVVQLPPL
ncbi:hypothetical protein FPANT_13515 [Fusarium pseudoanthophilum]|uniref:Uncharacterized protein n=1 Tax=Fusarium pseudoanthophilum TaxID=48495 RepID=A0A8H5NNY6_9HYPO|nr:hypothetical protein FPANT_13515 [Fusarium pseudoanthophilum]